MNLLVVTCLVGKVTTGCCPCISFFGRRSMIILMDWSEPSEMTQKPLDCPLALFSKNLTSWKSVTPISAIALAISWSVAHCKIYASKTQEKAIVQTLYAKRNIKYILDCASNACRNTLILVNELRKYKPYSVLFLC